MGSDGVVRRLVESDLDDVLVMCHRFFDDWHEKTVLGPMDERLVDDVIRGICLDGTKGAGWVAVVDGVPVGLLCVALVPNLITRQLTVEELVWWVDPYHRSGRLGIDLLRVAVLWGSNSGAQLCKMVAPAGSTVGRFLARVGYREMETVYLKRLE